MRDRDIVSALKRLKVETGSIVCLGCGYEHNCSTKGCRILREAADAIEELSRENKSLADTVNKADEIIRNRGGKWISVEERLPDMRDSDWVIGIANGKVGNMEYRDAVVMVAYDQDEGVWYLDSDPDVKVKVTYWMPLPEPPEGES